MDNNNIRNLSHLKDNLKDHINCFQTEINQLKKSINNLNCMSEINNNLEEIEFLQLQINNLNYQLLDLIDKQNCNNKRYKQLLSEVDNIYDLININCENTSNTSSDKVSNSPFRRVYTDTTKIHKFIIDMDIDIIFVTIVAGGGAGGIGFIKDMYYYSGGGGGAGACFIKKPIKVKKGSLLFIKVGKGGNANTNKNGEDSYVEIITCGKKERIVLNGGLNGKPDINLQPNVDGGKGGSNEYNDCFKGQNGENGNISIPSQYASCGGKGGNSHFYKGGNGGGNYFNIGGKGGTCETLIGSDGKYGSGGGGSAPKTDIDKTKKLSGNGGDGLVIIEW